jgi:hypothetical protein
MRHIILAVIVVIMATIAWFLISPAFISVEINEASPLDRIVSSDTIVKDNMDTMNEQTKQEFEEQTAEMSNMIMEMNDMMPAAPGIAASGVFMQRAHEVEGTALLLEIEGQHVVRFENFNTINGPDLRIYLAADASDDDFVELGKIKATKGNVNYPVPDGTDVEKYNHVLVWCKPFGVLFSYAALT